MELVCTAGKGVTARPMPTALFWFLTCPEIAADQSVSYSRIVRCEDTEIPLDLLTVLDLTATKFVLPPPRAGKTAVIGPKT